MHLSSEGRFIARKTLHFCRKTSPKRGPHTYSIFHLNCIPFILNWLDNWFHLTYGQAYVKVVLYTQNWLSDVVMLQNQHIFGVAMFTEPWNSICLSSSSSYSSATQTVSRRTVPPKRFWLNYCFKRSKQFIWWRNFIQKVICLKHNISKKIFWCHSKDCKMLLPSKITLF